MIRPSHTKRAAHWIALAAVAVAGCFAVAETISWAVVPPWPARVLRDDSPVNPVTEQQATALHMPWLAQPNNSWGLRDLERQVSPASGVRRVAIIGDSFVESWFTRKSLSARVADFTSGGTELVNLGVSGTGPIEYYFRMRDVALPIGADAVVLCIFAGNDFETVGFDDRRTWGLGPAEGSSMIGLVTPRLRWILKNGARKVERLWSGRGPRDDANLLLQMARGAGAAAAIARYVQSHDTPWLSASVVEEIVDRGDGRLWRGLANEGNNPELLYGWMLESLVGWETAGFAPARSLAEAHSLTDDSMIEDTASWIEAMLALGKSSGTAVSVVLIPPPSVDPEYVEFWRPWPKQFSWNLIGEDRERRLVERLGKAGVRPVLLRDVLDGLPGIYRKRDGHWTEKGQAIAAQAIAGKIR
jgi:hypothetical protein